MMNLGEARGWGALLCYNKREQQRAGKGWLAYPVGLGLLKPVGRGFYYYVAVFFA